MRRTVPFYSAIILIEATFAFGKLQNNYCMYTCVRIMHAAKGSCEGNVTTLRYQSLLAQCTSNYLAEVSPSRQSVGFIYK